jgi:branched-chain amino acid transport system ATP-binding protein
MNTLAVSNISVRYGGIVAVRNVDLDVGGNEVLAVLGANGAGKSSLLKGIVGLAALGSGTVKWGNDDITGLAPFRIARRGVVLVPEGRRVFAPLTVEENLLIGAYTQRSKSWQKARISDIYSMFPVLAERRGKSAGLLSGGEQQMLAFGRALMANPQLILMDEPSMGLAPAIIDLVMESVLAIAKEGIGVLMVEQNAAAALEVAHRAVVLDRGEVVLRGSAVEMRSHPLVLQAFLGKEAADLDREPGA